MGLDYYDRDGIPISLADLGRLLSDLSYKRVGYTKVMDGADPAKTFDVSTVWLGIDHRFDDGPPIIFETMVFSEGEASELNSERYSTLAAAQLGHTMMIATVSSELTDPIVIETTPSES